MAYVGAETRTSRISNPSRVLCPFHKDEAISIKQAAAIAGKSEGTVRNWCHEHEIGRRIAGGAWAVSRVALAMLLDGNCDALNVYLLGKRQHELVASYYCRLKLGHLLSLPEFQNG
jgi:hypothetical protein